jgi:hypothetical protein
VIPDAPGCRDWFDRSIRRYDNLERIGGVMQGTLTMHRRSVAAIAIAAVVAAGVTMAVVIRSVDTGAPAKPAAVTQAATPGWQVGLEARSAALNERYGLGAAAEPTATGPGWYTALMARSAALNRKYAVTGAPCVAPCEVRNG